MKQENDSITIRDDEEIIIFDATDDAGDDRDNRDVFTYEYMLAFAREEDACQKKMHRRDICVSAGVIIACLLYILLLIKLIC